MGTPSHLGHMDRVAATMPSQAHAGVAQDAPDIGQWEGQDVPLVSPSSCIVKGGIPSSRRYLPTYLHHMAMGPRLSNRDKPRHPLARRGARDPRPSDPKALGPDRAVLHLTMKNKAQLPTTLAGEKHFIVEGIMDDVITLAANTLAASTDAWDDAMGHPTASKDRLQETEDTLTPDLVDHLVQLTSAPQQHNRKTEGPNVTDWTILDRPRGRPHCDTNVPPTHLMGRTMERHRHNRQSPHIHTRNGDSNPSGTEGPL